MANPGDRVCEVCMRRAKERGGTGSCPLQPSMRGEFERGVRQCRYFRLGDAFLLRKRIPVELPASLF